VEAGVEVHLAAGDAVFFVDCMLHGSARKRTPGDRRVFVTRYGPSDFRDRYGYGVPLAVGAEAIFTRPRILYYIIPFVILRAKRGGMERTSWLPVGCPWKEREKRLVGPQVGPTSAFCSCIPTGMRGPTCIF
jgi:ectoine hydroxylase-related dioxygenase (phytanoyl-CoA dioxygenase family)